MRILSVFIHCQRLHRIIKTIYRKSNSFSLQMAAEVAAEVAAGSAEAGKSRVRVVNEITGSGGNVHYIASTSIS